MNAIDVHTHAFPDALAERAIGELEAAAADWRAVGSGTVGGLLASMDAAGVDVSVPCAIATKPDQAAGILRWCCDIRSDRIDPFPSVHPRTPDAAGWVRRIAGEGFSGLKLHPMYQDFHVDDARMDEIYGQAAEVGLAVTLHSGRDIAFPQDDNRSAPVCLGRVIDRFPHLTLICTHLGGWRSWDQVRRHLVGRGPNVYLETSFSIRLLGPRRAADLIRAHGVERVMFGTDWPWCDQNEGVQDIGGLGLNEKETGAILRSNAAKLLGYGCPTMENTKNSRSPGELSA